jgi:hypothetical protein
LKVDTSEKKFASFSAASEWPSLEASWTVRAVTSVMGLNMVGFFGVCVIIVPQFEWD